jgi:hypothetical protein
MQLMSFKIPSCGGVPERRGGFPRLLLAGLLFIQAACRSIPPAAPPAADAPQILFLLMFDDGPSIREPYNPTLAILDQLAANPVQPEIKALFFVQTGLTRITANVRVRDGIIYGYNMSLRRRSNIYKQLKKLCASADPHAVTTAIVNFHDTNPQGSGAATKA